jgi:Protein of unknown function (DUF3455)
MNRRIFTSLAATAAVAASILITGGASAAAEVPPVATDAVGGDATQNLRLPTSIQVDPSFKIVSVMRGAGAQVYTCGADGKYTLREPVATLQGARGGTPVIHGKGPFWASGDGSRVDGTPVESIPSPDGTSNVAWLKLSGAPVANAPGIFGNVAFIQRLNTRGGVAPTTPACKPSSTLSVSYSATYVFWSKK